MIAKRNVAQQQMVEVTRVPEQEMVKSVEL